MCILNPNVVAHLLKAAFTAEVSSWLVNIIRCTSFMFLKWFTMNWVAKMHALVSLPDSFGTNLC